MKVKRILTLNAGALKAISQIAILQEFEAQTKTPIYDYFSVIAGSSAGGINAALLSLGHSPEEIAALYLNPRNKLFRKRCRLWKSLFDPKHFRAVVCDNFGAEVPLSSTKTNLILFTQNLRDGINYAFSSFDNPDEKIAELILRTTAVPPFLPPHDGVWIDPGLGALFNPTEAAVRYLCARGYDYRKLQVINIESPLDPHKNSEMRLRCGGLQVYINHVIGTMFSDLTRRSHANVRYYFPKIRYEAFSFSNDRYYNPFNYSDLKAMYADAMRAAPAIVDQILSRRYGA